MNYSPGQIRAYLKQSADKRNMSPPLKVCWQTFLTLSAEEQRDILSLVADFANDRSRAELEPAGPLGAWEAVCAVAICGYVADGVQTGELVEEPMGELPRPIVIRPHRNGNA